MTEVAPISSGTHISAIEQSKVAGVLWTNTSAGVNLSSFVPQPKRCHTPAVGTMQPFGLPVDPDVYMTYITSGGAHAMPSGTRAICSENATTWASYGFVAIPEHHVLSRRQFSVTVRTTPFHLSLSVAISSDS